MVDADGAAEHSGYVLHPAVFAGDGLVEAGAHVFYPDGEAIAQGHGFDVNAGVAGAAIGTIEEVPEDEGKHVLVGGDENVPWDLVKNNIAIFCSQR